MEARRTNQGWQAAGLTVALLVVGAAAQAQTADDPRWDRASRVAYASVTGGTDGEYAAPVARVANSAKQWDGMMDALAAQGALVASDGRRAADLTRDEGVNWRRESVVLVALGSMPDLSCQMTVVAVRQLDHKLCVDVQVTMALGLAEQLESSPYQMLRVRRADWNPEVVVRYVSASSASGKQPGWHGNGTAGSPAAGSGVAGAAPTTPATWGGVKGLYR
jgi:hypothetical protein